MLSVAQIKKFRRTVLGYYRTNRRELPWRRTYEPYEILVSEVMLQQTQAERVIPKYLAWMKQFPTVEMLARAPLQKVLLGWQGLGYNRRALNLKRAAEKIVKEYDGAFPKTISEIDAFPGVGPYTAGAVAAFAFGIPSAFIETNIRTVYLHFFFKGRTGIRDEEILESVSRTLPKKNIRDWYNALMDYGTMLKRTVGNPNIHSQAYIKQSAFKGSRRKLRGEILRRAARTGKVGPEEFTNHESEFSAALVIADLVKEGFLKKTGRTFTLA